MGLAGGAERAVLQLAEALSERGHEVLIATHDRYVGSPHYQVAPSVRIINLNKNARPLKGSAEPAETAASLNENLLGKQFHTFDLIRRLQTNQKWLRSLIFRVRQRKLISSVRMIIEVETPDLVVAFMSNIAPIVAAALDGSDVKSVFASRITPQFDLEPKDQTPKARLKAALFKDALHHFDGISVLIPSYAQHLPASVRPRTTFIPNEVLRVTYADVAKSALEKRRQSILFVGRLEEYKGSKLLIQAFSQIANSFPDWTLNIYGTGPIMRELKELISTLGLTKVVHFKGVTDDMPTAYHRAQIFCLPSRYEGFPRAMSEAMASGLPCIGLEDCEGVAYLLKQGGGILVRADSGASELAAGLRRLMSSPKLREQLGKEAIEIVAQYDPKQIFDQWETYFTEIVSRQAVDRDTTVL